MMYPLHAPPIALDRARLPAAADPLTACATLTLGPAARAGHLHGEVDVAARVGLRSGTRIPRLEEAERDLQDTLDVIHRSALPPQINLTCDVEPNASTVETTARIDVPELSADQLHTLYAAYFADVPGVDVLPEGLPELPAGDATAQLTVRDGDDGELEVACALTLPSREPPASLLRPDA